MRRDRSAAAARRSFAAALLVLAGCGARPPLSPPRAADEPPRSAVERARDDYEMRLRAEAEAAMTERHWNDAALAWELLATLRRDDPLVAERLAECRERNRAEVAELEARAEQAARRGDLDTAAQDWWAVLALDPTNAPAAAALRKRETERNRKIYLGHHAGSLLTRRAILEAEAMPAAPSKPGLASPADAEGTVAVDTGPPRKTAPPRRTRAAAAGSKAVARPPLAGASAPAPRASVGSNAAL